MELRVERGEERGRELLRAGRRALIGAGRAGRGGRGGDVAGDVVQGDAGQGHDRDALRRLHPVVAVGDADAPADVTEQRAVAGRDGERQVREADLRLPKLEFPMVTAPAKWNEVAPVPGS